MFNQFTRRIQEWLQQMVLQPVVDEDSGDDDPYVVARESVHGEIDQDELLEMIEASRTSISLRSNEWPRHPRRAFLKSLPGCRPPSKTPVDREATEWLDRQLVDALSRDWVCVQRDLCLRGSGLRRLPDKLSVDGTLDLRGCRRLRYLGRTLRVEHDLWIGGQCRPPVVTLPESLTVGRDLVIHSCDYMSELPPQLAVGRNLQIQSCRRLQSIAGLESIDGNLTIIGCPKLGLLPNDLRVAGTLTLIGVPIQRLPEGLQVGRSLILQDCNRLTELPSELRVPGRLTIRSCPIGSLSKSVQVGENIRLTRCAELTDLGSPFSFPADLTIESCPKLEQLPAGLRVPGRLTLRRLPVLSSLPTRSKLGYASDLNPRRSRLVIEDCPRLAELPPDRQLDGPTFGRQ